MSDNYLRVLDKGYVRLVDHMGNDLSIVNAARTSYAKESEEFSDKDDRLLKFLIREEHFSPFRHAAVALEIYAPLFVARQWWKYAVASTHVDDQNGWNESSRRYVTEEPNFYIPAPNEWRGKPENSKQGSSESIIAYEPENYQRKSPWNDFPVFGEDFTDLLSAYVKYSEELYEHAMRAGIAAEQARLFLPAYGMYVRWRWTVSLAGIIHFLSQRLAHDAQFEIQEYAKTVRELTQPVFPKTFEAFFS